MDRKSLLEDYGHERRSILPGAGLSPFLSLEATEHDASLCSAETASDSLDVCFLSLGSVQLCATQVQQDNSLPS